MFFCIIEICFCPHFNWLEKFIVNAYQEDSQQIVRAIKDIGNQLLNTMGLCSRFYFGLSLLHL